MSSMTTGTLGIALALVIGMTTMAQAQPVVYPSKGQTPPQQQTDQGECQAFAQNQVVAPAAPAPPAPATPQGGRARGAARGAAIGAAGAAAGGGEADKGAAGGAAAGAVAGGIRQRQERREQAAQAPPQQAPSDTTAAHRAFAACMEGRGYTVR